MLLPGLWCALRVSLYALVLSVPVAA